MACLNVNSLLGRADELRVSLDHESHEEMDILVPDETKLDPSIHHNERENSPWITYDVLRCVLTQLPG